MKILFLDTVHPQLLKGLKKLGFETELNNKSSKKEIEAILKNYVGVVIRSRFKIDKFFLTVGKNLKFIARVGAGVENIDVDSAKEKGIHLISAPEGNRNAVAEHTLAMLLSLFNNLNRADAEVRSGIWKREENRGVELRGKVVGIIGYGNMGKAFARVLSGMGVEVIFYDIKPNIGDENAIQVDMEEVFCKTDVLSIHTPLTSESKNMINSSFLNNFHKKIYFLNTARGSIVVTSDLIEAIESNKILGACLDVLEYEKTSFEDMFVDDNIPKTFDYLVKSDKVILSPHIAGWTHESNVKMADVIVSKIEKLHLLK